MVTKGETMTTNHAQFLQKVEASKEKITNARSQDAEYIYRDRWRKFAKSYLTELRNYCGDNKSLMARVSGLSRTTIQTYMEDTGLL